MFDGVDAETIWKERYEQQTLKYTSLIANEYSASNCGLTADHPCIVSDPDCLLDRHQTMREKYFAAIAYAIFECARPTGYYQSENSDSEIATFGGINLKKYGLLDHPVDIVNYLVAASKIDQVLITMEPSEDSYSNPRMIDFSNSVSEFEASQHVVMLVQVDVLGIYENE